MCGVGLKNTSAKKESLMNLEEYNRRIEQSHSVTGIPSYWEDLQQALANADAAAADRDLWKQIAGDLADCLRDAYDDRGWTHTWEALQAYDKAVRGE